MTLVRRWWWLAMGSCALALALAACGGDDGLPLDEMAARLARSLCAATFRCCDASERTFASEAECVSQTAAMLQDGIDDLRDPLASGRIVYDADGAAACASAIEEAACTATRQTAADCVIFVGTVPLGGTCDDEDECAGGNFCDQHACVAPPQAGMECIGEECADGAYCYTRTPNDPPGPLYTCRALEGDGAHCTDGHQCQSGYCDPAGATCAPAPAVTRCDGV